MPCLLHQAGQERFAALARPYFRNADGVMIAYDVSRRSTFERATSYWLQEVTAKGNPNAIKMLVGTKTDTPIGEREVDIDEAQQVAAAEG